MNGLVKPADFMGDAAERAWETLYLWLTIARKMVTLTVKSDTRLNVPEGWSSSFFPRNERGGVAGDAP